MTTTKPKIINGSIDITNFVLPDETRLSELTKLTQPNKPSSSVNPKASKYPIIPTKLDIIKALDKDPSKRNHIDILTIKSFLDTTTLSNAFKAENLDPDNLNIIMLMCASKIKHLFYPKEKVLFKIGDKGDNFYLILKGKIEILKPVLYEEQMTGFDYLLHLIHLIQQNELFILNLIINDNKAIINIKSDDLPNLKLIMLRLLLDDYFNGKRSQYKSLKEIFDYLEVNYSEYTKDIDIKLLKLPEGINILQKGIYQNLPSFKRDYIDKFSQLKIQNKKINFKIYKYQQFLTLKEGHYFGDSALDENTTRNATIKTIEDTDFCYLDLFNYQWILKEEKRKIKSKEANFLLENFFFKTIPQKFFEKHMFNYFIYEEKLKGSLLFKEGEQINYVYFIKDGELQLSIMQNLMQTYQLMEYLSKLEIRNKYLMELNTSLSNDKILLLRNEFSSLYKDFLKRNKILLFRTRIKECLGIESFFYGLNYLYTVEVISKKVKYYRIDTKNLIKILREEKDCYPWVQNASEKRINIIYNRLFSLFKVKVDMIDSRQIDSTSKLNDNNSNNNSSINNYQSELFRLKGECNRRLLPQNSALNMKTMSLLNNNNNNTTYSENIIKSISSQSNNRNFSQQNKITSEEIPLKITHSNKIMKTLNLQTINKRESVGLETENMMLKKISAEMEKDILLFTRFKKTDIKAPNENELFLTMKSTTMNILNKKVATKTKYNDRKKQLMSINEKFKKFKKSENEEMNTLSNKSYASNTLMTKFSFNANTNTPESLPRIGEKVSRDKNTFRRKIIKGRNLIIKIKKFREYKRKINKELDLSPRN